MPSRKRGWPMADGDPWAVYQRLTAKDQGRLTPAERRLLALGGLRAEVNNGGFHQYFFNSAGDLVTDALDAAQVADADDLISLIRRALSMLNVPDPERSASTSRCSEQSRTGAVCRHR